MNLITHTRVVGNTVIGVADLISATNKSFLYAILCAEWFLVYANLIYPLQANQMK